MNKILPIILVVIFSQFPEVSLGYDDRDSSDAIPRIGQGGEHSIPIPLAIILGLAFIIFIINYFMMRGSDLIEEIKDNASVIMLYIVFILFLVIFLGDIISFMHKMLGSFALIGFILFSYFTFKLYLILYKYIKKNNE